MILLLLGGALAWGGDMFTPGQLVARADTLVEVDLPISGTIPDNWPNKNYDPRGWGFPSTLVDAGWKAATVTVLWPVDTSPDQPARHLDDAHVFSSGSQCWWKAHERGRLRALVLLGPDGKQVVGTEGEWGRMSDLNPDYDLLKAALVDAMGWTDERANAVDAAALWQAQRVALASGAPYRMTVAREWLRAHDGEGAITAVWGAPGSAERQEREALATMPSDRSICR